MRLLVALLALAAVLALTTPAPASAATPRLPERLTATFDVEAAGQTLGETRWSLAPEANGRLRFESTTRPVGLWSLVLGEDRREQSLWTYDATGRPRPLQYRFERAGRKARVATIEFDWDTGIATSTYRDRTVTLRLAPGTLDALVYVLALMQDLESGRPGQLAFTLAERGKVKTYALAREGTEPVETGLGTLQALRLSRLDEEGRRTTLWCAPDLRHLPVRMEHQEDGSGPVVSLRLRSVEGIARK